MFAASWIALPWAMTVTFGDRPALTVGDLSEDICGSRKPGNHDGMVGIRGQGQRSGSGRIGDGAEEIVAEREGNARTDRECPALRQHHLILAGRSG